MFLKVKSPLKLRAGLSCLLLSLSICDKYIGQAQKAGLTFQMQTQWSKKKSCPGAPACQELNGQGKICYKCTNKVHSVH